MITVEAVENGRGFRHDKGSLKPPRFILGEMLDYRRDLLLLTIRGLAKEADVSASTVYLTLNGRTLPNQEVLKKLIGVLGFDGEEKDKVINVWREARKLRRNYI